jgi:hypothetical protein
MLIEALLIGQRLDTQGGTSTSSCAASRHPSAEEIHSTMLLRSKVKQLVRQELIKALSDFKQWVTTPSSSQTQQPKPLVKVSDVQRSVDTQRFSHHRNIKSKYRKPIVKVIRNMVTKKWIFVKRNKQVNALPPCLTNLLPSVEAKWTVEMNDGQLKNIIDMAILLEALELPP